MHYHLEIIMPPVDDVAKAIEQIMEPFNENGKDEYGYPNPHAFWDWYQIGGRWSGVKTTDICTILDLPSDLSAAHVIVAEPSWLDDGSLQTEYMISDSIWNGVMHVKTDWDGKVKSAIDEAKKRVSRYRKEAQTKMMPQDNWLVVTVDYHS